MQAFGSDLLVMVDGIAAEDQKVREVRLAMLASNAWVPATIFPEHFTSDEDIEVVEDDGGALPDDAMLDMSQVEWVVPSEGASGADEYARTMAAMAGAQQQAVQEAGEAQAAEAGLPFDPRGEWV